MAKPLRGCRDICNFLTFALLFFSGFVGMAVWRKYPNLAGRFPHPSRMLSIFSSGGGNIWKQAVVAYVMVLAYAVKHLVTAGFFSSFE